MKQILIHGCALAALLTAGTTSLVAAPAHPATPRPATGCPGPMTFGAWGIDTANINPAIAPGDDFFTYANDHWLKTAKAPPGFSTYGQFNELFLKNEPKVRAVITEAMRSPGPARTPSQQIGDFYQSFMDRDAIEARGLTPIAADIAAIRTLKTHEDVARWMADPRSHTLVAINVFPDSGNPKRWLVALDQIGFATGITGMSGADAYLKAGEPYDGNRAAYRAYVEASLRRAGADQPARRAADLLALETKLAGLQWSPEKKRDRRANYHLMKRAELDRYAPGFPWNTFLTARDVNDVGEVILGTDTAIRDQAALFAQTPVDVWRSYLLFHWINNQAEYLPAAFADAKFDFYGRRLSGIAEQRPLEARGIQFANRRLGQLVGKLYVERNVTTATRAPMVELVGYLKTAFTERLARIDWMDAPTKAEAEKKLAAFAFKVAYPDSWRDYSALEIDRADPIGNVARVATSDWDDAKVNLVRPAGRDSWYQTPQTVDATYSVLLNAIELPAAILQPPFFDPCADPAVNFGAIGAVIAHEMGHGFDDQGAKFDSNGVLRNWWTDLSRKQFEDRSKALVTQYDVYSPLPGVNLNGRQGLGENIGDLTGASIAYRAYQLYAADHPETTKPLSGFTGGQRFFLSWAQVWRAISTESDLRKIASQGYHAPSEFRVNGVVRNIDGWYQAFGVKPGEKLYLPPDQRVRIW
jgi:putative endopeptidase